MDGYTEYCLEIIMTKITLIAGSRQFAAELNESVTGKAIAAVLPIEGQGQRWGGEIYFTIPVSCQLEADSRDILEAGELGYWPTGRAFCIFFGTTPASEGDEIRAASNVNVVGRVVSEMAGLWDVTDGQRITIELTE